MATNKISLDLFKGVDTDTIEQQIKQYGEGAEVIQNTGIERQGGVTNLYTSVTEITTDSIDYTPDGQKITTTLVGTTRSVFINDKKIGEVSGYGIEYKLEIEDALDICQDAAGNYITLNLAGNTVTIAKYDTNKVLKATRNVVFNGLPSEVTAIYFVRQDSMEYAGPYEFILRSGNTAYLLKEGTENNEDITYISSEDFYDAIIYEVGGEDLFVVSTGEGLGSYSQTTGWSWPGDTTGFNVMSTYIAGCKMEVYSNHLVCYKNAGISSFDGTEWKYYNGTGSGTGPYLIATAIPGYQTTTEITIATAYSSSILIVGTSLGVMNYNGTAWTYHNGTGAGSQPYTSYFSSIRTAALYTYNSVKYYCVVSNIKSLSSWSSAYGWKFYDNTGSGTGPFSDSSSIAGVINSMVQYNSYLVLGGSTYTTDNFGSVSSYDGRSWKTPTGGAGKGPYLLSTDVIQLDKLRLNGKNTYNGYKPIIVPTGAFYTNMVSYNISGGMKGYMLHSDTGGVPPYNMASSSDYINWTLIAQTGILGYPYFIDYDVTDGRWYCITIDSGLYKVHTKTTGNAWNVIYTGSATTLIYSMVANNGRMVATGEGGRTVVCNGSGVISDAVRTTITHDAYQVIKVDNNFWTVDYDAIAYSTTGEDDWVRVQTNSSIEAPNSDDIFYGINYSSSTGLVAGGMRYYPSVSEGQKLVVQFDKDAPITTQAILYKDANTSFPAVYIDYGSLCAAGDATDKSDAYISFTYGNQEYIKQTVTPSITTWEDTYLPYSRPVYNGVDVVNKKAVFLDLYSQTSDRYNLGVWENNIVADDELLASVINTSTVTPGCSISSYKNTKWKKYDGTGTGTGFYYSPTGKYTTQNSLVDYFEYDNGIVFIGPNSIAYYNEDGYFNNLFSETRPRLDLYTVDGTVTAGAGSCLVAGQYQCYLTSDGKIYSFDTGNNSWKWPDGQGAGTGPYLNDPTRVANIILSYDKWLIATLASAEVISWSPTSGWKYEDGSGTGDGPYNNGSHLGYFNPVSAVYVANNKIVFGARLGLISCYDGNLDKWVRYDGTGATTGDGCPHGNAILGGYSTSADYITSITYRSTNDIWIICGKKSTSATNAVSAIASGKEGSWKKPDGTNIGTPGTGWCYSQTALGSSSTNTYNGAISIVNMGDTKQTIVVGGGQYGSIASWDGTNWRNADSSGLGTGPFSTQIGFDPWQLIMLNSKLIVTGSTNVYLGDNGNVNYIKYWTSGNNFTNISNIKTGIYKLNNFIYDSKLHLVGLNSFIIKITPQMAIETYIDEPIIPDSSIKSNELNSVYTYKYDNGNYLMGVPGNSRQLYSNLDQGFNWVSDINARWALLQNNGTGYNRHIITNEVSVEAPVTAINNYGYHGYVYFDTTFNASVEWKNPTGISVSEFFYDNNISGYGVSEVIFKQGGTDIFTMYSPQYKPLPQDGVITKTNTDTNINAYGKITNGPGITTGNILEFRTNMISNTQSYLSVAIIDGSEDNVGTLISDVGYFDPGWTPIINGSSIIYKNNNRFYYVRISTNLGSDIINAVDDRLYKINTIHPLNLIDTIGGDLEIGSIDYNGRTLFKSFDAPTVTKKNISSVFNGTFSNSVDVGAKQISIDTFLADEFQLIGVGIPNTTVVLDDYQIDTYYDDDYFVSTLSDGTEVIDASLVDTLYIENNKVPISLGAEYGFRTAVSGYNTFITENNYDGYTNINFLNGDYTFFELYGQLYGFDNLYIYLIPISNGVLSTPVQTAVATGLKYLATTPNEAYFYSTFDNSLQVFSGGRSLQKAKRMSQMSPLKNGVFSVTENTLFIDTYGSEIITVRDQVITTINKPVPLIEEIYNTVDGILYKTADSIYRYSFNNIGTVVPLIWQSSYFGTSNTLKSILSNYYVTIFNENKEDVAVKLSVSSFNEKNWEKNEKLYRMTAKDYDQNGYLHLDIQPKDAKALGHSITVESNDKILISDISVEFKTGEKTVVAPARSR